MPLEKEAGRAVCSALADVGGQISVSCPSIISPPVAATCVVMAGWGVGDRWGACWPAVRGSRPTSWGLHALSRPSGKARRCLSIQALCGYDIAGGFHPRGDDPLMAVTLNELV